MANSAPGVAAAPRIDRNSFTGLGIGKAKADQINPVVIDTIIGFFTLKDYLSFETLRDKVLPPLIERLRSGGRVRIWSAGCSSGQEPYSIAISVLEVLPDAARHDIKILATDIDRAILSKARAGSYDARQISGISADRQRAHFETGAGPDDWRVN